MSEQAMALMKRIGGRLYYANPREFNDPGIYYARKTQTKTGRVNVRILALPQSVARCDLIRFPEVTHVIAKNQPQYNPLPAHRFPGEEEGRIAFCYRLNFRARMEILFRGVIWHQVLTFNRALQPQMLGTRKPTMQNPAAMAPADRPDFEPALSKP